MLANRRLAVLGTGMMGGALARGLIQGDAMPAASMRVFDVHLQKAHQLAAEIGEGCIVARAAADAVTASDIVLLAVKPQVLLGVLADIAPALTPNHIVVSIAPGIKIERMQSLIAAPVPIVRAMPNTPCLVGAGATALCRGDHATHDHLQLVEGIFAAVGLSVEVDEKLMDAVTAVSGSGPAYVYLIIEAMADGGVKAGLTRDLARLLAAQTVLGAAKMVLETEDHPAQLKDNVTTPGGTTIAALAVLERAGLRTALIEAIDAAIARARELGG